MVNGNYFGKIHNVIEQYLEGRNRRLERLVGAKINEI